MKAACSVAVLCVFVCTSAARADGAPLPGFKHRELRVVIDNLGDYPDHDFYLVGTEWVRTPDVKLGPMPERFSPLVPGEPYQPGYPARFTRDWLLIAVPRGRINQTGLLNRKELAAGAPGVLRSNDVQFSTPTSAFFFDPRDYQTHHFRIILADGRLTLTPGAVVGGSDGFRSWLPGLLLAGGILGVGLLIARRVRRRYAAS